MRFEIALQPFREFQDLPFVGQELVLQTIDLSLVVRLGLFLALL